MSTSGEVVFDIEITMSTEVRNTTGDWEMGKKKGELVRNRSVSKRYRATKGKSLLN